LKKKTNNLVILTFFVLNKLIESLISVTVVLHRG